MDLPAPPPPEDKAQHALQENAALREAFIGEAWMEHLRTALAAFYSPETLSRFSVLDTSRNPASYAWNAQNTLYEDTPTVAAGSVPPEALDLVATSQLWAQRSTAQLRAIAMGEGCVRVDIEGERITYRRVGVEHVELWVDPSTPGQPGAVRETRLRRDAVGEMVWTRELWDPRGIASGVAGTMRIETYNPDARGWSESTAEYWPGLQGYPYTEAGIPLLPYVLVHHRPSTVLRNPEIGAGLVAVTLGCGCMHTFWIHGIRDHAHPQPTAIDLVPVGATTEPTPGALATQLLRRDPSSVWLWKSIDAARTGSLTSLGSSMDPIATKQAIDAYVSSALLDAGLGPTDEAPAKGVSGLAIAISREALRRSQRQQRPAAEEADRLLLVLAGRMLRGRGTQPLAYQLPANPEAYQISYHGISLSEGELLVAAQRQGILMKEGLTERWRAIHEVHPHLSVREAQAMAERIEADLDRRAARTAPAPMAPPETDDSPDPETDETDPQE